MVVLQVVRQSKNRCFQHTLQCERTKQGAQHTATLTLLLRKDHCEAFCCLRGLACYFEQHWHQTSTVDRVSPTNIDLSFLATSVIKAHCIFSGWLQISGGHPRHHQFPKKTVETIVYYLSSPCNMIVYGTHFVLSYYF